MLCCFGNDQGTTPGMELKRVEKIYIPGSFGPNEDGKPEVILSDGLFTVVQELVLNLISLMISRNWDNPLNLREK